MAPGNSFEERLRQSLPLVVTVVVLFAGAAAFLFHSPAEAPAQEAANVVQGEVVVVPGQATIVAPAAEAELASDSTTIN